MAEHHSGPVEVGAEMDYAEHDKTYKGFIFAAKYGSVIIAALMIAMAAGFFTKAGFVFGALLWIILSAVGILVL